MEPAFEQWKSKEVARLLALVETERRYYQEMVTNLPVPVAVLNTKCHLVAANRAFRRDFGVAGDDMGKRMIDQILPSVELQARIQSVFESGLGSRPLMMDRAPQAAGGAVHRLRVSVQAIRDTDEDSSLLALLIVEDLAELEGTAAPSPVEPPKAAAGTVAIAPDESKMPDPLPCVIWKATAADRLFTLVSPSIKALLDIDAADWLNTPAAFTGRIDSEDRSRAAAFHQQVLAAPGLHSCEFRMRRPGAWYRETILVEEGSATITGVITDITARRAMEEQLLQAQRIDAIGHLAGRIAHDINNPLMIVNGYAEDLAHALPKGDSKSSDLREIQLAGKRIGEVTAHLQSATRRTSIDGGQKSVAPGVVDISAELVKVVERMRTAAGDYLKAEHLTPLHPLAAEAQASQLEAILLELSAALVEGGGETAHLILSAKPHRITESIRADQPLGLGEFVEVSILNQSHEAQPMAARMFESPIPGKEPGRGSGPALVKAFRTVQEWGGSILSVTDRPEILVYLKAATGAPPPPEPPAAAQMPPVEPEPRPVELVRKTSVLVVEDEPGIRALMRKILVREGFEVFEASTGAEALDLLNVKGPVSLLITDVLMPGMTGRELATQVQAADPHCGILYMSGFTADTGVETGQFPPGSHFLQKPFTLGTLLRKANEVLASTPRRPA